MKRLLSMAIVLCLILSLGLTALAAADDLVLFQGDETISEPADFGWNQGLTDYYGVPAPAMETVDGKLQFTLTGSNWVQTYYPTFKDAFIDGLKGGEYTYFRFYFENSTNSALRVNVALGGDGKHGSFPAAEAKVVTLDGTQAAATPVEANTAGEEVSHILIPVDFKGWIFYPVAVDKLVINTQVEGWGRSLITSYDEATSLEIDIRANVTDGFAGTQVIGTMALTKTMDVELPDPGEDPGEDPGQDTADFSVIAYAAAAIAGLGGLVVTRKRK